MRITHVIRSDGWAGVERHVVTLALEQERRGHLVQMIGGDPAEARSWLRDSAVTHLPVRTLRQTLFALQHAPAPDILHVHMTAAEIAAALSSRMRGVPVVSTRHFASRRGSRLVSRPAATLVHRRVAAQIAVSQFVAQHIEGPSTVVLSGVEAREVGRPAAEREPVVLVVQRLQPEKNTHLAVEAFAGSGLRDLGWRLHLAGTGPLREPLTALACDLGVADAVQFLGHRSDVPALMGAAGLMLAPHDREGYGLSVVEAMASGLPVVAAGAGGHLETVGRVPKAALFPPGDVDEAARLLRELAGDAALRDSYGRALQEEQRRSLTPAAQAEATELVYRRVLP